MGFFTWAKIVWHIFSDGGGGDHNLKGLASKTKNIRFICHAAKQTIIYLVISNFIN